MNVPTTLGRYQLRYRIAVGGMGGVYLAKATGAGGADKVVAVKLLHEHLAADEAVVSMFLDEARIVSAINHVNVSTVFDFGEQDGAYYLVMEYLEGESLDRVLKAHLAGTERHPLHPWLIARVLADAAEGLHAAHETKGVDGKPLDVVHRDVSPHNLFITYDGVAKVVDFGIARARERSTATDAGTFKGKFEYASPEQIRGKAVDRRADVWALGVCLWEGVSGARLFQREDPSATGRAVIADAIDPPSSMNPEVPEGFDAIAMRALDRDPSKRFQTAREFARALRELLSKSGETIDAPLVGEWLEELFPGDRDKRQALVSSVRRSGPDAPLESVPAELRIKGTGTGSSRNYRTGSSSGQRATMGDSSSGKKVPDPQRELGTAVQAAPSRSSVPVVIAVSSLVLVLGGGGLYLASQREPPPTQPVVEPVPVLVRTITLPVQTFVLDAGAEAELADAGVEPVDAGSPEVVDAGAIEKSAPVATPRPRPLPVSPRPAEPKPVAPKPVEPTSVVKGKPGDGRVRFKTPGATAEVFVDGKLVGNTPLTLELPAGQHSFELKARGFEFGGPQPLKVQVGGDYNVEIDMR